MPRNRDLKIVTSVLLFALIAFAIGFVIPTQVPPQSNGLPWQIKLTDRGTSLVFGLELSRSTLSDAQRILRGTAEVTLFAPPEGNYAIEAYFDKLVLAGLNARLVLTMDLPQSQIHAMYQRGIRMSNLGGGTQKVTLHADDLDTVLRAPISSIVYLPGARLDDTLIRKRFGPPAQINRESHSAATHWLYPDRGLDVAIDANGTAVLQYISPKNFDRVTAPLSGVWQ